MSLVRFLVWVELVDAEAAVDRAWDERASFRLDRALLQWERLAR